MASSGREPPARRERVLSVNKLFSHGNSTVLTIPTELEYEEFPTNLGQQMKIVFCDGDGEDDSYLKIEPAEQDAVTPAQRGREMEVLRRGDD